MDLPSISGGSTAGFRPSTSPGSSAATLTGGLLAAGAAAEFLHNLPANSAIGNGAAPAIGNFGGASLAKPTEGGRLAADRPAAGRGTEIDRPKTERPNGPGERADVGRAAQSNRPAERPAEGALVRHEASRIENMSGRQLWRQKRREEIEYRYSGDDDQYWYNQDWWKQRELENPYYPGFDYRQEAYWPGVSTWVSSDWKEPVNYSYGENVYYNDGSVYYGDTVVASDEEYAKQAEAIAESTPATKPSEKDWKPLGVFALTSDGEPDGVEPTMFLQLALSKQGVLSGTFQNRATDSVQVVEGMVDKQTQRAAWTAKDKARPLMEAGISNLTQDTAPALVHFADGTTQQWLLVRTKKSKTAGEQGKK